MVAKLPEKPFLAAAQCHATPVGLLGKRQLLSRIVALLLICTAALAWRQRGPAALNTVRLRLTAFSSPLSSGSTLALDEDKIAAERAAGEQAAAGGAAAVARRPAGEPVLTAPDVQRIEQPEVSTWEAGSPFYAAQSRCTVNADGSVTYDLAPAPNGVPFLFETGPFRRQEFRVAMCGAERAGPSRYRGRHSCFGPCIFQSRLCDQVNHWTPAANKSAEVLARYQAQGWRFGELSPCELFQRIRGRTLWFIGDSQTCHFFFAAECFLREFAPRLRREPPFPSDINEQFNTHDPPIKPQCLRLAHNTRVCQVRVDEGRTLVQHVLPLMLKHNPSFARDIVLFNFGLHEGGRGRQGFLEDLGLVKQWRRRRGRAGRPQMVWMDVPLQHFDSVDGRYNKTVAQLANKSKREMQCKNLTAWYEGDPQVVQGGERNIMARPHIAALADGHLATWNASVPLWDAHMEKGDCTHYCSPTAYHIWLFLLNKELARSGIGAPVALRQAGAAGSDGEGLEDAAAAALAVAAAAAAEDEEIAATELAVDKQAGNDWTLDAATGSSSSSSSSDDGQAAADGQQQSDTGKGE